MKENSIPSEYMVRVQCMTYNHAPYIEDTMNGFCMQETDFPFVCVIVDDASTDGEQELINGYLKNNFDLQNNQFFREEDTDDYHLVFARHKTNMNCFFGVLLLKYNHYRKKDKAPYYEEWTKAKYIALCEGDDYWTHPKKLKKQVKSLNKHPECSFSSTGFKVIKKGGEQKDMTLYCNDEDVHIYGLDAWGKLWIGKTLTLMIRKEVWEEYLLAASKYERPKDSYLIYHMFKRGICAYIPECMGAYNNMGQGIWNSLPYYKQIELDTFTMQELYFKNGRDPILHEQYLHAIVKNLECVELDGSKIDILVEAIRESNNIQEKKMVLKAYVLYCKQKGKYLSIGLYHKLKGCLLPVKRIMFY